MTFENLLDSFFVNEKLCNKKVYQKLLEYVKADRITPVIGAGLSVWAGYPLWKKLLSDLADGASNSDKIALHLERSEYEQAASLLEVEYCSNNFLDTLKEVYSPQKIKDSTRPEFQYLLPMLFRGPIVTTNFDVSLEQLFDAPPVNTPENVFQTPQLISAIQNHDHILVKLHGDINAPYTLVLTSERYDKNYGDKPEEPDLTLDIPKALTSIFNSAPPFFLGCGLGPDRTCAVLKKCVGVSGFALMELPEETKNQVDPFKPKLKNAEGSYMPSFKERRKQLDEMHLKVIWYPYGCHEAVQALIEQLAKDCAIDIKMAKKQADKADEFRARLNAIRNRVAPAEIALSTFNQVQANGHITRIRDDVLKLFADNDFINCKNVFGGEETNQVYDDLLFLFEQAGYFMEDCRRKFSGDTLISMEQSAENYHKWIKESLDCIDAARRKARAC